MSRPEERLAALDRFEKRQPRGTVRVLLRAIADPDPRVSLHATVRSHYGLPTKVSDAGVNELRKALPNLQVTR